jgi:type I restriction enzyme S subunit
MTPDEWRSTSLGEFLRHEVRPEHVRPGSEYRLLGVRLYGKGCHQHAAVKGAELKTTTLFRVKPGDVTYNKMWATKGAFAVVEGDHDGLFASSEYPTFECLPDKVTPRFVRWALTSQEFVSAAADFCTGTTSRARLNPRDFLRLQLRLPPLADQEKIAAILSSVEEAEKATKMVIDQLLVLRKAMMADLLTRGLPGRHTTFKQTEIGEVPHSWGVALLDQVAKRGSGHTPNKNHPEYWGGSIKWVSLTDSPVLDRLYIKDTTARITPAGIANSSAVEHPAGTVILSRDGSRVGKSAITIDVMAVSQHFIAWVCGQSLDSHFLYYLLQYKKPEFARVSTGSTTNRSIGLPYFRSMRIPLPGLDEQRELARVLTTVDLRLFAEEEAQAALADWKSALMSALLTGEVRAKPEEAA